MDDLEFGADLAFQAPTRFLVDTSLEDGEMLARKVMHFLPCLIVRESTSELSKDDLAMAICRVLDSNKPGEELYDPKASGWRDLGMLDVMQDNANGLGHWRPFFEFKAKALVTYVARALDKAKMMRFDEKSANFYRTELGRIASHFYIQYSSVETYNEMLRRHMNDSEVIDMVAHSSEFKSIVVREEEQNELEMLLRSSCPLEVKGNPSNKHEKISTLIQLYISHGSIDTFSLVSDAAFISASLARIMRALFEICLRRDKSEMSLFIFQALPPPPWFTKNSSVMATATTISDFKLCRHHHGSPKTHHYKRASEREEEEARQSHNSVFLTT
ncbi:hypothetical protein DKX38_022536 [Salix brachista]|uniref:SEC63 domain-containing protein n=1 Tax=Salix brachista TaxID=2182728 RepID=A0A5N5KBF9_9ROSI|nr:hypothetical protein DKX38_022536 [Salix brachista]